jgi:hypothetical protein
MLPAGDGLSGPILTPCSLVEDWQRFGKTAAPTFMAEVNQVGILSGQTVGVQNFSPMARENMRDYDVGTIKGGPEKGSSEVRLL